MHSSEVHSDDSACRKSGRLGLEQVCCCGRIQLCIVDQQGKPITQHQNIFVKNQIGHKL